MAKETWIAGLLGGGLTFTAAITSTTLNSLASGSAIASDLALNNSTTLDIFCSLGIQLGTANFTNPGFVGVYLFPINQDGTTYGDGRGGSAFSGPPGANYWVGNIAIAGGTGLGMGTLDRIILPPRQFKFVIWNQLGVTLASAGLNNIYISTYDRSIA